MRDVDLMVSAATKYNRKGEAVHGFALEMKRLCDAELSKRVAMKIKVPKAL